MVRMKVVIIFPEKNENKWLRLNSRRKIHGTYVFAEKNTYNRSIYITGLLDW